MSKSRRHLPWITPTLKRHMRKRDRLFKKARKNSNTSNWTLYRLYRNKVAKLVHQAKQDYVSSVIGGSLKENPKTFWSYVKKCRTESIGIPSLRTDSGLHTSDKDKAECLNKFFHSVFTDDCSCHPQNKGISPYPAIGHLHIHRPGVAKQLRNLNPSKACGPDQLPPKLLKLVAEEIAPALAFLFQQSINTGDIPSDWKNALVTPIHKSGDKCSPGNYRPISLTCICSKVMEHIVLSHISKHVSRSNILVNEQHGFRQKLSTNTQLISATHDWAHTLQRRGQTDVAFLDFQKAFDRVPHRHLQTKLEFYGITADTLRWIMALLTNRQQVVIVNGSRSSWMPVTSGVPQGSVIGPVLFLLYINDITSDIKSTMRLFADDSVIYRDINSEEDNISLQHDLQALSTWSQKWLMSFNVKKCAVITITRKRKPYLYNYTLCNESIPRVNSYKYLGVTVTKDLRWKEHCQLKTNAANKTLGLLRRTLAPCPKEVKEIAYKALVRPKLEYCADAWNPYTSQCVDNLERVQKAAARFVLRDYRSTSSSSGLVSQLGWDLLHTRRLLSQSTMFFKIHQQLVNIPFPAFITPASYISRNDHSLKLTVPVATIDPYKFSFYPRAIRIWNCLPLQAVTAPTPAAFQEAALPAIRRMKPPIGDRML